MSDIVKLALVGAGLVGRQHLLAMDRATGVALDCIVEPGPAGPALAAEKGVPHFDTLAAMLKAAAPGGVILATPTRLHVPQAMACVAAGRPVLVEKPIGVSGREAHRLVLAADAAGVPLLTGHHRRYNAVVAKAHEIVASGAIGDIRAVQATCWFYKPDDYFNIAPWRKEPGAGPVSVNLVHDVDILRYLCGEVVRVQASATPSRRGYANEDVAAAVLTFASGAIGTIAVSDSIAAPWSWEMTAGENPVYASTGQSFVQLGGSDGALSLPDLTIWRHDGSKSWWSPMHGVPMPVTPNDPLAAQLTHFAEVIRSNAEPLVSGAEGLRTLEIVEAIQEAARTGQAITPGYIT